MAEPSYDVYAEFDYPPELYKAKAEVKGIDGYTAFQQEHVSQFKQEGFLLIKGALDTQELEHARAGLMGLISGESPDFRGVQYEKSVRGRLDELSTEERIAAVRKLQFFVGHDDRLTRLSEDPDLLRVLEAIIGEKPGLFANQAMVKPARIGREKPWHQDHAYFDLPMGTQIVSAWVSLDAATTENGCMHVIPRSHRAGPVVHFQVRDWQLCDDQINTERVHAVPTDPGDILLWDGLLHHGTPPNRSDRGRRALQLHYWPASVEKVPKENRLALFGSEGKDVTC
ncbi:MAG: phytanoyl-CoA dioxygenase family protein [Candidatus Latescibacterota bacterium]|nr:phytanoyl-CoA dioxygenase family protein [Candidatus Latescibacterota bacterium]